MGRIVWLASYPKSGNTWLRVFLQGYRHPAAVAGINDLEIPSAAWHALFDRFGALEVSDLTDDEVERLRPALYRTLASAGADPLFLKVHDAFGATADGVPLFPADATCAVVYVVRHPGDVAVSLAHHAGIPVGESVATLGRDDAAGGDRAGQCRQRLRSWSGHVTSWIDESRLPVCTIRYEDLLADPGSQFARLLACAGLAIDRDRLRSAIEQCRFERLQAQERATGFVERSVTATAPFFRGGRSGEWRERLTPDLARRLVDAHGEVMRRFGYLPSTAELAG